MPGGNRTGPVGMGPKTGRGVGYCSGYDVPGYMNAIPGRGVGFGFGRGRGRGAAFPWGGNRGRGWGRGWRWRNFQPAEIPADNRTDSPSTLQALQRRLEQIKTELSDMNEQIKKLRSKEPEEESI